MKESLEVFEHLCKDPELEGKQFILFFNKVDLLDTNIKDKSNFEEFLQVFPDYKGEQDSNKIKEYVKEKFQSLHQNPKSITCAFGSLLDHESFKTTFEEIVIETLKKMD